MKWLGSEVIVALIFGVIACLYTAYRYITGNNDYFSKRNVPYIKPTFLFGSVKSLVLRKTSLCDHVKAVYNQLAGHNIAGMFEFLRPSYVVRDPELIKYITVKDFDHFVDLPAILPEDAEPILTKGLQVLKGNVLHHFNCCELSFLVTFFPKYYMASTLFKFDLNFDIVKDKQTSRNTRKLVAQFSRHEVGLPPVRRRVLASKSRDDISLVTSELNRTKLLTSSALLSHTEPSSSAVMPRKNLERSIVPRALEPRKAQARVSPPDENLILPQIIYI